MIFRTFKRSLNMALVLGAFCVASVQAQESPLPTIESGHPQFSYAHKEAIAFGSDPEVPLSGKLEQYAKMTYGYLNKSRLFDTSFIVDAAKVRDYHLKKKFDTKNNGKVYLVSTSDGYEIECTFFDRGSDELIVIGNGFTNEREKMTSFVEMYQDCDVVLFDFRGHGYKKFSYFDPTTWPLSLARLAFSIDPEHATLGAKEELDTFAVVDSFRNFREYKKVYGVSVCYGSFIFLKAQALRPEKRLFDKIIVDGCWKSLPLAIEKIRKDLKIMCDPQRGGWSKKWPLTEIWAQDTIEFLVRYVIGLQLDHQVVLSDYLSKITDTPVLFFYGKDDLLVHRNEFEELWDSTQNTPRAAIVTSNPHVRNHIKQKELYKLISELFLQEDFETFKMLLKNPEQLINRDIYRRMQMIKKEVGLDSTHVG